MCLIALQWQPGADPCLVVVANRDEWHARPTAGLGYWDDAPHVLAGRDLQAGGTWMGVTRDGRFAALTNIRETHAAPAAQHSRGLLVADYLRPLKPQHTVWEYAQQVAAKSQRYAGFNLLLSDGQDLLHVSNRDAHTPQAVSPGVHGLSNALLDTAWPKVQAVTRALRDCDATQADSASLMRFMDQRQAYPSEQLPDTGVGEQAERMLSPAFICTPTYGTRGTTVLRLGSHSAEVVERRFNAQGEVHDEQAFEMYLQSA